jgi:thiol-disulfide isomerase/thioredoxin
VTVPSPGRPPRERRGLIGPFSGRQLLAAALIVVVSAVLLVVVTTPLGSVNPIGPGDPRATQYVLDPNGAVGVQPGNIPPELAVQRPDGSTYQLADLDGAPVRLADLRGKAVWINFFASWCPPCQSETPILRDLADEYRDRGLVVIGISVRESDVANVAAYAAKYQLGYTIAPDFTGLIFDLYHPPGLPTHIFVGPDGRVRSFVLAPLNLASARAQVEAILPSGATSGPSAGPSAGPSLPPPPSPGPSSP